jgi:hypothetical protein
MSHPDKIISPLLTGHASRTPDNWPARRQLYDSVNKISFLPSPGTGSTRDKILVLTALPLIISYLVLLTH